MKKKSTPAASSRSQKQALSLGLISGFWRLRCITETEFKNEKKGVTTYNRFQKPGLVLIEAELMHLIWNAGTKDAKTVQIQIYRGKVVTRLLAETTEVRANCELSGGLMFWQFVLNRSKDNYTHYTYEFLRED
ncbi:MAG: hypothetical protein MUC87_03495 [Bacteroidia bacterium]|jgi:hypothetical protein|nr:hypothetical protein [Bacteroidia bacterium]